MANYATLKTAIQNVVKTNGNNEITGALLQQSLLAMINSLGADYSFVGVALPSTNPGTPDQNVFYIAGPGTYSNFSGAVVGDGYMGIFKYNGSWTIETIQVGKNYDTKINELTDGVNGLLNCFQTTHIYAVNRLNPTTCQVGLIVSTGQIYTGGSYDNYIYTDYIPVVPGKTYSFQYGAETIIVGRSLRTIARYCLYDQNKERVGGSDTSGTSITIPNGAYYMRVSIYITLANVTAQYLACVEGTTPIDFVPYAPDSVSYVLKPESNNTDYINQLIQEAIGDDEIPDQSITASKLSYQTTPNLFDKNNLVSGTNYWPNTFSWNGSRSSNASYFSYRFPVLPNQQYVFGQGSGLTGVRSVNEYDENGTFIAGSSKANQFIVTTSANTHFLECSFGTNRENLVTVEPVILNGASVHAFLPNDIYVALGRTIELYNNQVCIEADKYHIQWRTAAGKALARKLSIAGLTVKDDDTVFVVYDEQRNVRFAALTKVHIIAATAPTKTVVPLGDSLTNAKRWLPEVVNLSGGNISYVGSYPWTLEDADNTQRTGGHEGRSGFSSKDYATGAVYTYGGETTPNIWWNGSRFSFTAFKNATGLNPDIIQIWVGVNGLAEDNNENVGYIKQMVDNIRLDNATIPILICVTPYKADQNGIGGQGSTDGYTGSGTTQWSFDENYRIFNLMQNIYQQLGSYSNVNIINLALFHDSKYNYGWQQVHVNPRAAQLENIPNESVHPALQGYFQIADILFSNYCGLITQ